jgi:hypothetical protein
MCENKAVSPEIFIWGKGGREPREGASEGGGGALCAALLWLRFVGATAAPPEMKCCGACSYY